MLPNRVAGGGYARCKTKLATLGLRLRRIVGPTSVGSHVRGQYWFR